jgi:hypothetical protein
VVIEYEGLGWIGRRVSRLVLLRYLELYVAVGIEGDGDEIRPAAYCTVLGVDLPRATTGIHEGVVLLAAERARVGHGFSGYRKESGDGSLGAAIKRQYWADLIVLADVTPPWRCIDLGYALVHAADMLGAGSNPARATMNDEGVSGRTADRD